MIAAARRTLRRSPALKATVVYGLAGVGFAAANLILARVLPTVEFAIFALGLSIVNFAVPVSPLGADGVVNRRHVVPSPWFVGRVLGTAALVGAAAVTLAWPIFDVEAEFRYLLFVAIVAGGATWTAAAHLQSLHRFGSSLALSESGNIVLGLAALLTAALGVQRAWVPFAVFTGTYVAAAAVGWGMLLRAGRADPRETEPFSWFEALSYVAFTGSALLLVQLERLTLPYVRPLEDLATFAVLAAVAGSAFRMLYLGVGYSLLPRLRRAESVVARRRLLRDEAVVVAGVVAAASLGIWYVTPLLVELFVGGKYVLSPELVLAAIASGIAKVMAAFSKAVVTALAGARELAQLSVLGWVSVGVAVGAAVYGARWGLAGVVYGVGLGWLTRALAEGYIGALHLRDRPERPVPSPLAPVQEAPPNSPA
ncbi:MAG TPA: hypothetical protein VNA89_05355 [Gemmatimonadaceae bacterium]|nr:hypothetical protein [Gemmatimonadaceae bacterium]